MFGRFTAVDVDEHGHLQVRCEGDDDGHIGPVTEDRPVRSVVYLPDAFTPSAELLALRVQRPAGFQTKAEPPAPFTLRYVGDDPTDSRYRLYETYFPGRVVSGTLTAFEVNAAAAEQGYPYRGPLTFRGTTKKRPAQFSGEKSVVRIAADEPIPEILLDRP